MLHAFTRKGLRCLRSLDKAGAGQAKLFGKEALDGLGLADLRASDAFELQENSRYSRLAEHFAGSGSTFAHLRAMQK